MTSLPCAGTFGRLFGHSFSARYSEERSSTLPQFVGNLKIENYAMSEFMDHKYKRTYHHDICTRCGVTICTVQKGTADHV